MQHTLSTYLYLYLLMMGCVASQLYTPISLRCRSNLFLKALTTDVASITVCGSLFHSFTMRRLKKCCLTVVRHLGLNNFMECSRTPVVTSASWKNVLGSIRSFPVKISNGATTSVSCWYSGAACLHSSTHRCRTHSVKTSRRRALFQTFKKTRFLPTP